MLTGGRSTYARGMCRNIRPLNNFEPPATRDEVSAAMTAALVANGAVPNPAAAQAPAFQPTRFSVTVEGSGPDLILIPGLTSSRHVFDRAVREIAHITQHLLDDLVTTAPPKNREVEAAKARARAEIRYAR